MPTHHRIPTLDLTWTPDSAPGVERKLLTGPDAEEGLTTSIARLVAGAVLPGSGGADGVGRELLVLDGELLAGEAELARGDYLRQPVAGELSTESGCTVYLKEGAFGPEDREITLVRFAEEPWLPGQGNLRVRPLHSFATGGTAYVHWPAGERFVPHRHFGGEEILVISGTFIDEHGEYPEGTWLRSPHLRAHHPFVQEETVIFVKTGHLNAVASGDSSG